MTLFASGDSRTAVDLAWISKHPYSEDRSIDPKVWECMHIAELFKHADEFDLIHNHYDFLPLNFSHFTHIPIVTTIHGFSSPSILPVYKAYNQSTYYVAVSKADKSPQLDYIDTIYHGIDVEKFPYQDTQRECFLFLGRIHPDKGVHQVSPSYRWPLGIDPSARVGRQRSGCAHLVVMES